MGLEACLDEIHTNCALLGCILALVINYPKLIHGCDSRDVVRSKFLENDRCYRLKPRVVTCGWHQGFPAFRNAAAWTKNLSSTPPSRDPLPNEHSVHL